MAAQCSFRPSPCASMRVEGGAQSRDCLPRVSLSNPHEPSQKHCISWSSSHSPIESLARASGTRFGARHSNRSCVKTFATASATDPYAGVAVYKPNTYDAIVDDAVRAVQYALKDNMTRMEVEFPPLPASTSSYKGSSDDFIDANLNLALAFSRKLYQADGLKIKLVLPDKPERRRAARVCKAALEMVGKVTLGCLDDVPGGPAGGFFGSLRSILDLDIGGGEESELWQSDEVADLYIILNASTAELPSVQRYLNHFCPNTPSILFNLELDTLRSDLGLLGFPPKDIHYQFLANFTPVYYIRIRDYSKSVAVAPFILNYSGALLRQYPGPWQVMLKQGDGSYVCVAEGPERFNLGQVKQELLISLGLEEEKGSTMAFLRQGYKTMTWWEEEQEAETSAAWRN
eukprot:TRINITY_DN39434_c0_g1_i1.p1 TRINITY_DN39434_c0_g1~~TRINITY_DN39434_c0_g1_i1.p1  ORF type:complete len:402 (+),score=54.22 TRINITY_DN39434_c0_g1_i1:103-1308(+)